MPGCPPMRIALPAILPSLIMVRMIPADLLALDYVAAITRTNSYLPYHTLRNLSWLETIVESESYRVEPA